MFLIINILISFYRIKVKKKRYINIEKYTFNNIVNILILIFFLYITLYL